MGPHEDVERRAGGPALAVAGPLGSDGPLDPLGPVDDDKLVAAVGDAQRILIVDECRITGSQSEALLASFVEHTPDKKLARIAADDSFIPLGRAATLTLPSRDSIHAAAKELLA